MGKINIQDRDAFSSFYAIAKNIVNNGRKKDFLPRGYILNDIDDRTTELNMFMGANVLDFMLIFACDGRHKNSTTAMATQDVQRHNKKQNMTTIIMQILIIPTDVVAEMDHVDIINHRQRFPTSFFATIRAVICLVYEVDSYVVFRLAMAITNIHPIEHVTVINISPQNIEPRVILPLSTHPTLLTNLPLRHAGLSEHDLLRSNSRETIPKPIFFQRITSESFLLHSIGTLPNP